MHHPLRSLRGLTLIQTLEPPTIHKDLYQYNLLRASHVLITWCTLAHYYYPFHRYRNRELNNLSQIIQLKSVKILWRMSLNPTAGIHSSLDSFRPRNMFKRGWEPWFFLPTFFPLSVSYIFSGMYNSIILNLRVKS